MVVPNFCVHRLKIHVQIKHANIFYMNWLLPLFHPLFCRGVLLPCPSRFVCRPPSPEPTRQPVPQSPIFVRSQMHIFLTMGRDSRRVEPIQIFHSPDSGPHANLRFASTPFHKCEVTMQKPKCDTEILYCVLSALVAWYPHAPRFPIFM